MNEIDWESIAKSLLAELQEEKRENDVLKQIIRCHLPDLKIDKDQRICRTNAVFNILLGVGFVAEFVKSVGKGRFICEMCDKDSNAEMFSFQNAKIIPDYDPRLWKQVCNKCLKREIGSNRYKQFRMEK